MSARVLNIVLVVSVLALVGVVVGLAVERGDKQMPCFESAITGEVEVSKPVEAKTAPESEDILPTTMTVGGRTYDILSFVQGDGFVGGYQMIAKVREMSANLGQEEGEHFLKNQGDIPVELRGEVTFVFTDWRHAAHSESVSCVYWSVGDRRWVRDWGWLDQNWYDYARVLRRK